mgnify:CR=1 FL=1
MQNMWGQLDQRRQIEEVILNITVKQQVVAPPLDYTLIKFEAVSYLHLRLPTLSTV